MRTKHAAPELTNRDIGELLAQEGDKANDPLKRAYKRAARAALGWPVECADLHRDGKPFTSLERVGPFLAGAISQWFDDEEPKPQFDALRDDFMSWTQAQGVLGHKPAWRRRCRGDLQMHSTWSDGSSGIESLAEAGIARGYDYIAVTDHSKGLKIAGGIDEDALLRQADEIDKLNKKLEKHGQKLRVLHALEMNLRPDGSGDMEPEALARLDLVIGAFHSKLRIDADQTERYFKALANPHIQVLAHPRGRIYNFRLGLKADWKEVFKAASLCGKAVEIDGYPDRQDLNRELLKLARRAGATISLGSDSHNATQLHYLDYSLASACEAGLPAASIINFLPRAELFQWVAGVRSRCSA